MTTLNGGILMKKSDVIKPAVVTVLILLAYVPTFIWMYQRWTENDTYYSHGFLVPLISVFIVWLKRSQLSGLKIEPDKSGWIFFMSGLFIHILSAFWRVYFSSGFSLILILIGLIQLSFGKEFLKRLTFPVLFLVFMIPLPLVAIAGISFRLKILAAQIATFIVNKLGIPAIRDGSVISTRHSYLVVEDPCSGVRSLIALIALGALIAYFSNISKVKKSILFLSSIPIAIASNIVRIVSLTLISEIYGAQYASGLFHDIMGIFVFVFAFLALMSVANILE